MNLITVMVLVLLVPLAMLGAHQFSSWRRLRVTADWLLPSC